MNYWNRIVWDGTGTIRVEIPRFPKGVAAVPEIGGSDKDFWLGNQELLTADTALKILNQ